MISSNELDVPPSDKLLTPSAPLFKYTAFTAFFIYGNNFSSDVSLLETLEAIELTSLNISDRTSSSFL